MGNLIKNHIGNGILPIDFQKDENPTKLTTWKMLKTFISHKNNAKKLVTSLKKNCP